VGECSFWYRPTRVVPDQRPLNGRCRCIQVNFWLAGSLEPPVKNWRVLLEQIFTDCNAIATDNHQIGYTEKVLEIIVVLPRPFL